MTIAEPRYIEIEVVYALAHEQWIIPLRVAEGTTLEQAVRASGLLEKCQEISLITQKLGIYGKAAKLDTLLRNGDRVEIYRPLIADPKEIRRQRAEAGKVMKKGGGDLSGDA